MWCDLLAITLCHTATHFFFLLLLGFFQPPCCPSWLTQAAVACALPHPQVLSGAVEGGASSWAPDRAAVWKKERLEEMWVPQGAAVWVMLKASGQAENHLPSADVIFPVLIYLQFAFASTLITIIPHITIFPLAKNTLSCLNPCLFSAEASCKEPVSPHAPSMLSLRP